MVLYTKIPFTTEVSNYFSLNLLAPIKFLSNFLLMPFQIIYGVFYAFFHSIKLILLPFIFGFYDIYEKMLIAGNNLIDGILNFILLPTNSLYGCISLIILPLRLLYTNFLYLINFCFSSSKTAVTYLNTTQFIEFIITLSQYVDLSPI